MVTKENCSFNTITCDQITFADEVAKLGMQILWLKAHQGPRGSAGIITRSSAIAKSNLEFPYLGSVDHIPFWEEIQEIVQLIEAGEALTEPHPRALVLMNPTCREIFPAGAGERGKFHCKGIDQILVCA
jgi:hypothetical protein